ncbi:unnamed protein product [Knipowitschia caucasica]|uniref:AIG1-type G domain-containing protein n=1 Tax=Knipowitschia caucasica TaxID=637954 RepID=A0AAV2M1G4_KNICA
MIDYSLNIIDTPGFGDTWVIKRDHETIEQIRNLFSNNSGVDVIHTVCFVAQSALARLSDTQCYMFDSILSIFGKDMAENLRVLVTFADRQLPPVLEAITAAGVPCPKDKDGKPAHYRFNNSALFVENPSSVVGFDEMFWNMGRASMKSFFDALSETEPKILNLTKEVLREITQLEETVENLQRIIKEKLEQQDKILQLQEQIKKHEAEIETNTDFEITIKVIRPVQTSIAGTGNFITNCSRCHHTCHYPCSGGNDSDKKGCSVMNSDGNCTKCPGKCIWSDHHNQKYRWEYNEVTEMTTVDWLKERYQQGTEEGPTTEGLVVILQKKYQLAGSRLSRIIQEATAAVNRLGEIALRPNPLSPPDYIDMMIESEKSQRNPGWRQRVKGLEEQKEEDRWLKSDLEEQVEQEAQGEHQAI